MITSDPFQIGDLVACSLKSQWIANIYRIEKIERRFYTADDLLLPNTIGKIGEEYNPLITIKMVFRLSFVHRYNKKPLPQASKIVDAAWLIKISTKDLIDYMSDLNKVVE